MLSCSSFSHASRSEARTAQAVWFGVVVTLHTECDVTAPFHTPVSPVSVRSSAYRSHHHAAAGMDVLARQPTRLSAHYKGYDVGDVLRRAESLERRGLLTGLAEGGIVGHHGSVCEPWGHRVHGDTLGRKFVCQAFRELFESPLAAEVNSGTGKADMSAVRGNVHDASTFLDDLGSFLQSKIRALGIESKHAVELFLGRLDQGFVHEHACIVDQDVQSAKALHRFSNQATGVRHLAHVGLDRNRLAAFRFDFSDDLLR